MGMAHGTLAALGPGPQRYLPFARSVLKTRTEAGTNPSQTGDVPAGNKEVTMTAADGTFQETTSASDSASGDRWVFRLGGAAAIAGAILGGIGNLVHPDTPMHDPVGVGEQIQVVLAVLKGGLPLAGAARGHGVASAAVGSWRGRFAGAGRAGMDVRSRPHTGEEPTDQRRSRAVLRHAEVRTVMI
jgi:hypothetical protein